MADVETCLFGESAYNEFHSNEDCDSIGQFNKCALSGTKELGLFSSYWEEMLNNFGQPVEYWVNTYQVSAMESNFYGENATNPFWGPTTITMGIELTDVPALLGNMGYITDEEIVAYVAISTYEKSFTSHVSGNIYNNLPLHDIEPKAGDRFQLACYGNDRPGRREGRWFEITNRTDEDLTSINQMGGHYVWKLTAKRLKDSFEPYENDGGPLYRNNQITDDEDQGVISTDMPDVLPITDPNLFEGSPQEIEEKKPPLNNQPFKQQFPLI